MKMASLNQKIEVDIRNSQFGDRPRKGEDVPLISMRQENRHTSCNPVVALGPRRINPGRVQALHCEAPEVVGPDQRCKRYTCAEASNIMHDDSRRTTQGGPKIS